MKKLFLLRATKLWPLCALCAFCALCALCVSCAVFPPLFPHREAWPLSGTFGKGTMTAGKISVDSVGAWGSLEREIAGLLPLLLVEKGYAPGTGGEADRRADVSVIEREYMEGWKTKKSLSVEVRIRSPNDALLAAGRAMVSGDKSFASSNVTNLLVRSALSKALSALEADQKKKQ
jgi:hypothetical protein